MSDDDRFDDVTIPVLDDSTDHAYTRSAHTVETIRSADDAEEVDTHEFLRQVRAGVASNGGAHHASDETVSSVDTIATSVSSAPVADKSVSDTPPPIVSEQDTTPPSVARPPAAKPRNNGVLADFSPAQEYLKLLPAEEQAKIASHALLKGPGPTEADWLIAYSAKNAADQISEAVAKIVELNTQPKNYVVEFDDPKRGPVATVQDITDIGNAVRALQEQVAALPHAQPNVGKLVDPFAKLAESTGKLVAGIEALRATAETSIRTTQKELHDTAKEAREHMKRTAFEGHALPARTATYFAWTQIGLTLLAIVIVAIAILRH